MTLTEIITVVGGAVLGYVAVSAFIGRNTEKPEVDSAGFDESEAAGQHNSSSTNSSSTDGVSTIQECFDVLGISKWSSAEEIRSAYKTKIKDYHPDKVAHLGEKLRSTAAVETVKLNSAYSRLKEAGYLDNT